MIYIVAAANIICVICAYLKTRDVLHPAVVFSTIVFYNYFLIWITGDISEYLGVYSNEALQTSQFIYFITFIPIFVFLVIFSSKSKSENMNGSHLLFLSYLLKFSLVVIVSAVLVRLWYVNFAVDIFVEQTLGPRFGRSWMNTGAVGGSKEIASLLTLLLPVSVSCLGVLLVFSRFALLSSLCIYFVFISGCVLLFFEGSRIFFVVGTLPYLYLKFIRFASVFQKSLFIPVLLILYYSIFSVIYNQRDSGFLDTVIFSTSDYTQDDSGFWVVNIVYMLLQERNMPSFVDFILASLFNFVPRSLWESKPLLDDVFYSGFKISWVTVSRLGEFLMVFGFYFGVFVYWCVTFFVYRTLIYFYAFRKRFDGLILYMVLIVYVFMVERSFLNFSQFIYAPLLVYLFFFFSKKRIILS
ncbi:O-antigen polymerase [Limnobacter sp.]|uniref:O-antigen polymerase n=1 Tax=Limnobacter sp. TaxID=2003368 RepID=UPI0039C9E23C